ncbi:arginine--tRNA ligase [Paenibacillus tepidiphilus]|uniref:arginine--tRNA ligase n=1 Tax=Paenibacillus tepidiphilus TaxID=2608683 RepID=UPI00123A35D2|nr:arginine--tRNA ligase [Paenibacillus tepidiphilus]
MVSQLIVTALQQSVQQVFQHLGANIDTSPAIALEQPANPEFGDYSSNIAMQLAKVLRKAPSVIAELIAAEFRRQEAVRDLVDRIDIAAPGFINLYINWPEWVAHTSETARSYELPATPGQKVVVEHTSVNPNKSMHIGHLRNSCIGDTLVRLLRKTGYEVEVHNYVDDLGNQLADTVVGLLNVPLAGEHGRFGDYCWDIYAGVNRQYAQQPETVQKRTEILHALEQGGNNTAWLGQLVAERIVREHVAEMHDFGIDYDLLVWESSIVREGFWSAAFELLKNTDGFVQEQEGKLAGCWILKHTAGDPAGEETEEHLKDKVLVRSNGILTYTAKDIAYHLWKFGLLSKDFVYSEFQTGLWTTGLNGQSKSYGHADKVINVIDYRQEYPQAVVKQALESLGYHAQAEQLHHVSYGVVSLSPASAARLGMDISDGKSSYAMSGRQGIGIKVTELIGYMEKTIETTRSDKSGLSSRAIAIAAIRYYLLRFNLGTEVIFDFEQATEISGNTGVYLMYTYARAGSVLGKSGLPAEDLATPVPFPEQLEPAELALLRQLSIWHDTLLAASRSLTPNTLCNYAHTLASLFNNFYSACPILKGEQTTVAFRLWLTGKFQGTLGEALEVLGLPLPERM